MNKLQNIPYGLQDYLPLEYSLKEKFERKMVDNFLKMNFQMVETPVLENMDVFCLDEGGFQIEELFKVTDNRGGLLVLRPDMTMPIARMAATKLSDSDSLRLCYCGNIFHLNGEQYEGFRQVTQIGVELLGESSYETDAEVLMLAIKAIKEAGLKDFQIEIGQTEFFRGLMVEAGLNNDQYEQMRVLVEDKNMLGIEMLLDSMNISSKLRNDILELPMLYGGAEILETAKEYSENNLCKLAVENIEQILDIIEKEGLMDYVSIDLSLVPKANYYTGVVFQGICANVGYPLLTGGRYDNLVKKYGKDMPAIGFAMVSKHMLIALEREGAL